MEHIWFKSDLADEIIKNNDIFDQTKSIVTGIVPTYKIMFIQITFVQEFY